MTPDKLTRRQKLQLLQALKDGKIPVDALSQPSAYIIIQRNDKPGIYEINGKEYDRKGYEEFMTAVKAQNDNPLLWHEEKTYEPVILNFVPAPDCEPILDE